MLYIIPLSEYVCLDVYVYMYKYEKESLEECTKKKTVVTFRDGTVSKELFPFLNLLIIL